MVFNEEKREFLGPRSSSETKSNIRQMIHEQFRGFKEDGRIPKHALVNVKSIYERQVEFMKKEKFTYPHFNEFYIDDFEEFALEENGE